jgi:hypothetical protein
MTLIYPNPDWRRVSPAEADMQAEKLHQVKGWLDDHVGDGRYRVVIVRGGQIVCERWGLRHARRSKTVRSH